MGDRGIKMMDEYIKMILALEEELFKGWKWKEGDRGLIKLDNEYSEFWIGDSELINKLPGYRHEVHTGLNVSTVVGITYDQYTEERFRPLPSPEQLLKICECDGDIYFESLALLHFANWLEDKVTKRHDFCLKYRSAKEMMLLWVMEKKYNKTWNGESWENEE